MAQPVAFTRAYGATVFTDESTNTPTVPHTGTKMDGELNNVKTTTDQIRTNLALIQRDDGAIANKTIGPDQLADSVYPGVNAPTTWLTATAYTVRDSVINGVGWYRCLVAHTSGTFATDLAAADWVLIYDFTTQLLALVLTSVTPTNAANGGTAAVGTGTKAAREDHAHAVPQLLTSATPADLGVAAVGVAVLAARADHVHNSPAASLPLALADGGKQTAGFTAASNTKYECVFGAAGNITLPAAPAEKDIIVLQLAGYFVYTLLPNGNKINTSTSNLPLTGNQTITLSYTGATDGWV